MASMEDDDAGYLPARTYTEVALTYSSLEPDRVLIISDHGGVIELKEPVTRTARSTTLFLRNNHGTTALPPSPPTRYSGLASSDQYYKACASVSLHGKLTTTAKPHEPWILRINYHTKVLELDLSQTEHYEITAGVHAFEVSSGRNNEPMIQLLLVDHNGVILKILLDHDLQPMAQGNSSSFIIDTPKLLTDQLAAKVRTEDDMNHDMQAGPLLLRHALQTCQIAFVDASKLVLALNPFLITVSLTSNAGAIENWSLQVTQKNTKKFDWVSVLGFKYYSQIDLPPCLAIVKVALNASNNNTHHLLVSLHNNGTLYLWTLPTSAVATVPTRVIRLQTGAALPRVDEWTSDQPVRPLCAKLYADHKIVIGVALQTSVPETGLVVGHAAYNIHAAPTAEELELHMLPLSAPGILLDWELVQAEEDDDNGNRHSSACQLLAMFSTTSTQQAGRTMLCAYPPAANDGGYFARRQVNILDPVPVVQPSEFLLYSTASHKPKATAMIATVNNVADAIHAVDKQNMQRLFRNCHVDLVPSRAVLLQALQECVPGYRVPNNDDVSLELETLLTIQELRKRQLHSKRFATTTPSRQNTFFSTPKKTGAKMSIYEQLTPSVAVAEEPAIAEDADGDGQDDDLEQQVEEHQQRWNMLFSAIQREQVLERLPCLLKTCGDELFLLRPGTASFIRQTGTWNLTDPLTELDEHAMHLVRLVEADPLLRESLAQHEQLVWNFVASGKFAVGGEPLEAMIKESLAKLRTGHWPAETERAIQKFQQLQEVDRVMALQNMSFLLRRNHLPGLNLLSTVDEGGNDVDMELNRPNAPPKQLSFSAMNLTTRCFDSLRRLCLGRILLLLSGRNDDDQAVSLRMYVHMVGLLWASSQPLPDTLLPQTRALSSPPSKKGGTANAIEISTVLGTLVPMLSEAHSSTESLAHGVILLSKRISASCLQSAIQTDGTLSELGIIAYKTKRYSGLALRLLAPFVRYASKFDSAVDVASRKETLAKSLLRESRRASKEMAVAMVQRAQLLLPFDIHDLDASKSRLELLCQNLVSNPILAEELLDYVDAAIAALKMRMPNDVPYDGLVSDLFTARFSAALVVHRWDDAVMACFEMRRRNRQQSLERLVRAMVETGDLARLIEMCGGPSELSERAHLESYVEKLDFASIVVDTLSHSGLRDGYVLKATQDGPFTDYFGALFALYTSQGEWKQAAEVQNMIYENARHALENEPANIDARTRKAREELIVKDMVSSCLACRQAMDKIPCENDKFIIPRVHGELSGTSLLNSSSPERVRPRAGNYGLSEQKDRPVRLVATDVQLRSHLTVSLSTLYSDAIASSADNADANDDADFAKSFLNKRQWDLSTATDVFAQLQLRGFIQEALVFAFAVDEIISNMPLVVNSHKILDGMLESLITTSLFPLVHYQSFCPERPTLGQITRALDLFGDPELPPTVLIGDRSKVASCSVRADIRTAANELMRRLTCRFTTAYTPLALKVASLYIKFNPIDTLPQWLEDLLVFGSDKSECHGMFAKYSSKDSKDYPGDPSSLLALYTQLGLYEDACRVVAAVLAGPDPAARRETAPSRLAQRGKTDYVPVEKIDLLYNLMDIGLRKGVFERERLGSIQASQKILENALIEYFELLQISVEGKSSAMAIQS